MPPISGFSIGKEAALDLAHPSFGVVNFGLTTGFDVRPIRRRLESMPITNGGQAVYRNVFSGWEGTFEIDRSDGTVDAIFQALEDNYYGGAPETYWMLTQTITNPDGSVEQYRYKNIVLEPESAGNWRGEEKVSQRFGFVASRRERV